MASAPYSARDVSLMVISVYATGLVNACDRRDLEAEDGMDDCISQPSPKDANQAVICEYHANDSGGAHGVTRTEDLI